MSQAQSENRSQYEGILEWATGIARAAALGMGFILLLNVWLKGRSLPQGTQFVVYASSAAGLFLLNRELLKLLKSASTS